MSNFSPRQLPCNCGLLPIASQGPRFVQVTIPFAAAGSVSDDLVLENENGLIEGVQGIYLDTSATDATVTVQFLESGQKITVPKNTQAYLAALCGAQVPYKVTSASGTTYGPVTIYFLNFPVANVLWTV